MGMLFECFDDAMDALGGSALSMFSFAFMWTNSRCPVIASFQKSSSPLRHAAPTLEGGQCALAWGAFGPDPKMTEWTLSRRAGVRARRRRNWDGRTILPSGVPARRRRSVVLDM